MSTLFLYETGESETGWHVFRDKPSQFTLERTIAHAGFTFGNSLWQQWPIKVLAGIAAFVFMTFLVMVSGDNAISDREQIVLYVVLGFATAIAVIPATLIMNHYREFARSEDLRSTIRYIDLGAAPFALQQLWLSLAPPADHRRHDYWGGRHPLRDIIAAGNLDTFEVLREFAEEAHKNERQLFTRGPGKELKYNREVGEELDKLAQRTAKRLRSQV